MRSRFVFTARRTLMRSFVTLSHAFFAAHCVDKIVGWLLAGITKHKVITWTFPPDQLRGTVWGHFDHDERTGPTRWDGRNLETTNALERARDFCLAHRDIACDVKLRTRVSGWDAALWRPLPRPVRSSTTRDLHSGEPTPNGRLSTS